MRAAGAGAPGPVEDVADDALVLPEAAGGDAGDGLLELELEAPLDAEPPGEVAGEVVPLGRGLVRRGVGGQHLGREGADDAGAAGLGGGALRVRGVPGVADGAVDGGRGPGDAGDGVLEGGAEARGFGVVLLLGRAPGREAGQGEVGVRVMDVAGRVQGQDFFDFFLLGNVLVSLVPEGYRYSPPLSLFLFFLFHLPMRLSVPLTRASGNRRER